MLLVCCGQDVIVLPVFSGTNTGTCLSQEATVGCSRFQSYYLAQAFITFCFAAVSQLSPSQHSPLEPIIIPCHTQGQGLWRCSHLVPVWNIYGSSLDFCIGALSKIGNCVICGPHDAVSSPSLSGIECLPSQSCFRSLAVTV